MEAKEVFYTDDHGNDMSFTVGNNGVTKILKYDYCPEPYCCKYNVQVFKDDKLFCELFSFNRIFY